MAQEVDVDIVRELTDATAILDDARARVDAANVELRNRIARAREFAKVSRARLGEVRQHWETESHGTRDRFTRLQHAAETSLAGLEAAVGDAVERGAAVKELASTTDARVAGFTTDVTTRARESQDSLTEQLVAVEHAFTSVEHVAAMLASEAERSTHDIGEELSAWLANAQEQSQKLVSAVAAFATHGHSSGHAFSSALGGATSAKLSNVEQALLTTALNQLTSSSAEARRALAVLGSDQEAANNDLHNGIRDVLDRVQDVLDVLERVRPLLETIRSLLG